MPRPPLRGESLKLLRRRLRAWYMQARYRTRLRELRYYGLFIGYPRSGHTLVAALLDAHPNMLFANGLDAGRYIANGFNIRQLALLSIWNSLRFTRHGRRSNGYGYAVPGGWHGRWRSLEVIGDKSGDLFSARLLREPALLDAALERLAKRARFVHVVRNPYDCISSMAARGGISRRAAAREFFAICDAIAQARKAVPREAWLECYLEELIAQPAQGLNELCAFFGQRADGDYIASCSRLILPAPRRDDPAAEWDAELLREVGKRLRAYEWFDGYAYCRAARTLQTGRAA